MAGAQVGVDIIIRARDQIKAGADSAAKSLQGSFRSVSDDFGNAFMGNLSRNMFRGMVASGLEALDGGLHDAVKVVQAWADGSGKQSFDEAAAIAAINFGNSFVGGLRSIPVAGAIGELLGEASSKLFFDDVLATDRMRESAQAAAQQVRALSDAMKSANESAESWLRRMIQGNDENEKWNRLIKEGEELVSRKWRAAVAAANGEFEAIQRLNAEYNSDIHLVRSVVAAQKRKEAEAEHAKQEADRRAKEESEQRKRMEAEDRDRERKALEAEQKRRKAEEEAERAKERAQQEEQRRVEELISAEQRLAGARESTATRALQFRAGATGRATGQPAGMPGGLTDPRMLKELQEQRQQGREMVQLLRGISEKLPEYVNGN